MAGWQCHEHRCHEQMSSVDGPVGVEGLGAERLFENALKAHSAAPARSPTRPPNDSTLLGGRVGERAGAALSNNY